MRHTIIALNFLFSFVDLSHKDTGSIPKQGKKRD